MEAELYDKTTAGITLNLQAESFLRTTAKWGKVLAIVGFIFTGLMILGGLFAGSLLIGLIGTSNPLLGFGGKDVITFSFVTILYLIPVFYLYKFSSKMSKGLEAKNEAEVTESFKNLKSLFKFMGVFTIIIIGFYVLGLLFIAINHKLLA